MEINVAHSDIGSELCQSCAGCCRILLNLAGTSSRYRKFLRTIGFKVLPEAADGQDDCCAENHDIRVDMGHCKHLDLTTADGQIKYSCSLYGTDRFPELCADFDCVSWAKHGGNYHDGNPLLQIAQRALNRINDKQRTDDL